MHTELEQLQRVRYRLQEILRNPFTKSPLQHAANELATLAGAAGPQQEDSESKSDPSNKLLVVQAIIAMIESCREYQGLAIKGSSIFVLSKEVEDYFNEHRDVSIQKRLTPPVIANEGYNRKLWMRS